MTPPKTVEEWNSYVVSALAKLVGVSSAEHPYKILEAVREYKPFFDLHGSELASIKLLAEKIHCPNHGDGEYGRSPFCNDCMHEFLGTHVGGAVENTADLVIAVE
jgi:hypothetical protein